jgi:Fe2+ transport system protein FeoA
MRVVRVLDQEPAFLRRTAERGLVPGVSVRVVERDELAGEVQVLQERGEPATLSTAEAMQLVVQGP